MLLGRAWPQEAGTLPSFLYQKIKILYNRKVIFIKGDPKKAIVPKEPVLGICSQDLQRGGGFQLWTTYSDIDHIEVGMSTARWYAQYGYQSYQYAKGNVIYARYWTWEVSSGDFPAHRALWIKGTTSRNGVRAIRGWWEWRLFQNLEEECSSEEKFIKWLFCERRRRFPVLWISRAMDECERWMSARTKNLLWRGPVREKGVFHSSSQLKIMQTPLEPLEEEDMLGNIFVIMAMEEDYLGDSVHLIKLVVRKEPAKKKKYRGIGRTLM